MKKSMIPLSCLAALAGAFLFTGCEGVCPPQGPWPMPPWCSSGDGAATAVTQPAEPSTATPYPVDRIWGYVTPTAALPAGSPVKVVFEVALPRTDQPVTLNVDGQTYSLESSNGYYFASQPVHASAGTPREYYFNSGGKQTETQTVIAQTDFTIRDGLNWVGDEPIRKPGFVQGYGAMDFGGFNVDMLHAGLLPSMLASMQSNGGEWYMYDYYWSYTDYTLPEIVDESIYPEMNYPTQADLETMASTVHAQGMKFILLASVEWSAIPGNPCYQYHGDADQLASCSNNYWLEGRTYEQTMLDRLVSNPNDADALAYRDKWFAQYENYLQYVARVAEENGIEMVIIGKNTTFARSPIHEEKWRAIISRMRETYHGKIAILYECYNDSCLFSQPWVDDADVAVVYYWFRLSNADAPTEAALKAEFGRINRSVITPFYQQNGVPVIFITPFMSRDHPARQEWVEPASSAPEVGQDMAGQAGLYELFFETSIDEPWFQGVIPYGYWFFDGFHEEFAFDRSYNVRNKPAAAVLRSWFSRIDNAGDIP